MVWHSVHDSCHIGFYFKLHLLRLRCIILAQYVSVCNPAQGKRGTKPQSEGSMMKACLWVDGDSESTKSKSDWKIQSYSTQA